MVFVWVTYSDLFRSSFTAVQNKVSIPIANFSKFSLKRWQETINGPQFILNLPATVNSVEGL